MAISTNELTRIADKFLTEQYGMTLDVPLDRNNRLKRKMGRFTARVDEAGGETPHSIEIAGFMFEYAADEVLIDTVLHECVHYALFVRGEPFEDGHPHFESEIQRHGIGSTETNYVGVLYNVKCAACENKGVSYRKPATDRHLIRQVSRCCEAPIEYLGEAIYDGTEAIA